jgi:3-dehydroquinate synthase
MELGDRSYDIHIGWGLLSRVGEYFSLDRRVLILTDDGVPAAYAEAVADACRTPTLVTVPQGEESKALSVWEDVLAVMLGEGFTRADAVVAVGGGVVGDLGGFVAASYMRGVDFYNIPTTLLSQVDSSIGGKTAVDFRGVKNIIGAFHQPRGVLIDPALLKTLDERQMASGMAEIIKMAATSDEGLFSLLEESEDPFALLDEIIPAALRIKKAVVEADEREGGLRRILNFGHTVGHGIESAAGGRLLHGECVALGMLPMTTPAMQKRLLALYRRVGLPTSFRFSVSDILSAIRHDKKAAGDAISYVFVPSAGSYTLCKAPVSEFLDRVEKELTV